jgi:hypothetical protein
MFNKITLIALTFLISGQAYSASISIVNHSFESNFASAPLPNDWVVYDPTSTFVGTGIYPVTTTDDAYNSPGPVPVPPDGDNVAWTFLSGEFDQGVGNGNPAGIEQVLSSTLTANSHYELSVAVGNPQSFFSTRADPDRFWNNENFPGYIIQLFVDDLLQTVLVSDINSVLINEGDFGIASLSLTVDDSHTSLLGFALGIRLLNQNTNVPGEFENIVWAAAVDFDNVQLSVSAVPVPAAFWLFGTALIGFIGISRRRKVA